MPDEGDPPRFGTVLMHLHFILDHIKGDIRHVEEIVGKIFLYQVPFIAQTNNEFINALRGINFQNMPDDRPSPNFYHGFRTYRCFFADPRSKSSSQYDRFHFFLLKIFSILLNHQKKASKLAAR
jgi:hypothetical protein